MPWVTVALAALSVLALVDRRTGECLVFDRGLILAGQAWRAWTGHLAHYDPGHLGWNLAVFLPAGCWLERDHPARVRWFYLVCPVAISAVLLGGDPTLARYAGLSGVAAGALVLLACRRLREEPAGARWIWAGMIGLVGAKIILEAGTGTPWLADARTFRAVPLAHLAGAACGVLFGAGPRRPR